MVKKKLLYIATVAVVLVVLVAFVFVAAFPAKTNNTAGYTILANVNKDCTGTPWYVGVAKGYFVNGNINFVDGGPLDYGLQPAALISGKADIYDGHPNTIINLLESGAKVKGVVMSGAEPEDGNVSYQHMHWLVLENSTFRTVADLFADGHKPKIAILAEGICADLETIYWLAGQGYTRDQYELITLSDPLQENALRQGSIDVAVLHPPFFTAAEQHGGVRILTTSESAFGATAGVSLLVFTEDAIKNKPDAVRAFIKAFKNSERWSNDHPIEAGQLTADTIGLTSSKAHWYSYSGEINDSLLQPWIDAMVAQGIIKAGQYKPSDLYTTEFNDTWVNETSPQPLDPYPTNVSSSLSLTNLLSEAIVTRPSYLISGGI
jgi:ABC-type nitrate/sulfonate/bicarbonate transport system substrate-binding protein